MNTETVRFTGPTVRIPKAIGAKKQMAKKVFVPDRDREASWPDDQTDGAEERRTRQSAAHPRPPRPAMPPYVAVVVREVATRRDRDQFVTFPWKIYAGDKNWAPPLLMEAKAFIDRRRHPFYRHGEATQFLAYRAGEVVGRILVSDDPNYNAEHGTNLGSFGMFECVDDQAVANALLNTAANWLRRRGRTELMGPIDYSTNYPCGLLIDGFDTPQRVMMNHNPPYYARLLENWRLTRAKDLYAWWFDDSCDVLTRWARRAERLADRGNVRVRPISFKDFDAEVARCHKVYNAAWEKSWGFVKLTEAEFRHMAGHLKQFAVPELILLAEVDGQPAGFCVTLPDFNEATTPVNGRLTTYGLPIGLVRVLRNMRRIRTARMAVLGVVEQFRRRGVAELFILRALEFGRQHKGYTGAELGWTLEDNELINRTIEKVGGRRYKTYRIYHTTI
ncbi:MAG: N-acetyltransferase [Planctomycetia bacterium]|nr:N-acetyltransferase [Planctomycetia bacterium]